MGMADKDVAHRPSADCRDQRREMRLVLRTRIDDADRVAPDHIAVGAVKGEWAGIVHRHPQDIVAEWHGMAVFGAERGVEGQGHACSRISNLPVGSTPALNNGTADIAVSAASQYTR